MTFPSEPASPRGLPTRPPGHRPSPFPHGPQEARAAGGRPHRGGARGPAGAARPRARGRRGCARAGARTREGVPRTRPAGRGGVGGRGARGGQREPSGRSAGRHARAPGPAPVAAKLRCLRPRRRALHLRLLRLRRPPPATRHHASACWPPRNRPRSIKPSAKRVRAVLWTTVAYELCHVKQTNENIFDFSFSDFSENPPGSGCL